MPDPQNPFPNGAPSPHRIANRSVQAVVAVEQAGNTTPLGGIEEVVLVDPVTGAQEFRATNGIARSDDGRLIDASVDGIYFCRGCARGRLTAASVTTCHACGEVTCRRCLSTRESAGELLTVCAGCKEPSPFASLTSLIKWIFSL